MDQDGGPPPPPVVDVSGFTRSPLCVHSLQSTVPRLTCEEECLLGIDEAGRGPVLGPMVYGVSYCPISKTEDLQKLKFADSKALTVSQREDLYHTLTKSNEWLGWKATILSPNYLSNCMLRRSKYNLNSISHDTAIDLIKKVLADGVKLSEVYVDTVGKPETYQSKLQGIFPQLKITVSKKADSLFPIVSAASICAKVIRDACLTEWRFTEESNSYSKAFGSGYTSDDATIRWMKENIDPVFGFPTLVRFSWSTAQKMLESEALLVKWPDDDEEEDTCSYPKIGDFFGMPKANGGGPKPPKRHRYFEERKFDTVDHFF